jgi:hypothetical protein
MDLFIQLFDQVTDVLTNDLGNDRLQTILLGRAKFDELPATRDQLAQFGLFFRADFHGPRIGMLAEAGDDAGVQSIGLGQNAQAAGEVSDLAGIDHGHPVSGRYKRADQAVLVAARGFDYDQTTARVRQSSEQLPEARGAIRNGEALVLAEHTDIERALGNIDTYEGLGSGVHEQVPVLRMRARSSQTWKTALAAVRVKFTRPATNLLRDGVIRTQARSICGGFSAEAFLLRCESFR